MPEDLTQLLKKKRKVQSPEGRSLDSAFRVIFLLERYESVTTTPSWCARALVLWDLLPCKLCELLRSPSEEWLGGHHGLTPCEFSG